MIQFPCHCSYIFKLEDDMAGATIQCPKCRRLNDIPGHGDAGHLDESGAYRLAETPPNAQPEPLANYKRIYAKSRVDDNGQEIDLRPTLQDIINAGTHEIPLAMQDEPTPATIKYDPETGELIRPIKLEPVQPSSMDNIPLAAPTLPHARGGLEKPFSGGRICLELLLPANFVVLLFIMLGHLLTMLVLMPVIIGVFIAAPILLLAVMGLIAHYGNIIEETGPLGKDDIPRPLGHLSWSEDIWGPCSKLILALSTCYGPAGLAWEHWGKWPQMGMALAMVLALAGTVFFPAVLLTAITSGSFRNLRPDRLLGVIRAWGAKYVLAVILWILSGGIYLFSLSTLTLSWFRWFGADFSQGFWHYLTHPLATYPLLLFGIYMMHLFCWYMGSTYRTCHPKFPWVLQLHDGARRENAQAHGFPVLPANPEPPPTPPSQMRHAPQDPNAPQAPHGHQTPAQIRQWLWPRS